MGEAVVLVHPQDCLKNRLHRNKSSCRSPNPRHNPNPDSMRSNPNSMRSNRRKRSPTKASTAVAVAVAANPPAKNLVMGQVKILKRGEPLKEAGLGPGRKEREARDPTELALSTTDRLGPEPEMVPKLLRISELYAGSAGIVSPPPSSLPLPGFFTKKGVDPGCELRRMLGLDLPLI